MTQRSAFHNPVIPGYHPDPSICRVGDTYYLVVSSFSLVPGVPVFRSTDLVHWEQIGNVLDRPSQYAALRACTNGSEGIYAPTIRHHDGRFYMITTSVSPGGLQNFFVTADDPAGPWSDPVNVAVIGIDPDLAWDDDGNCWMHSSIMGVTRARIDDRTGEVLEAPVPTWSGTGLHAPEAPHLLRRGDWWYLLIAEGGTERGHTVAIARSTSPVGPWEPCPHNPIVSHRSLDHPIQNTGHADLVEAPDGSWWMVLLGVRPTGWTPRYHVMGRETFLVPIEWRDGWPVATNVPVECDTVPQGAPSYSSLDDPARDDFDGERLHPRWVALARSSTEFGDLTSSPGSLTLHGLDRVDDARTLDTVHPVYVGRRQQHHGFHASTVVSVTNARAGAEAGLAVFIEKTAHYTIAVEGDRLVARARVGALTSVLGEVPLPDGAVVLAVRTEKDRKAPDLVCLGYHDPAGEFVELARVDGRYLSTEVVGGFNGRTVGVFATACDASYDWFEYAEIDW